MSRGRQILSMVVKPQDKDILTRLNVPSYEKRGTTSNEQKLAIAGSSVLFNVADSTTADPLETDRSVDFSASESDYVPSGSESSSSENSNANVERKQKTKISKINKKVPVADTTAIKNSRKFSTEKNDQVASDSDTKICISKSTKKLNGILYRDKKHCCCYCYKMIQNMPRHFERSHKTEKDVAKALSYEKQSKDRINIWAILTRTGDFHHNCEVISQKKGTLILMRRPSKNEKTYHDYTPCPHCLGFLKKDLLWHHTKNCCNNTEHAKASYSESLALLSATFPIELQKDFITNVVSKFRNDEIANICKEDVTILKFGELQYFKYKNNQLELIRQSMRQLGRLLVEIKKANSDIKDLADCLATKYFDVIVCATRDVAECGADDFKIPSLALKLGHALRKCIGIRRGLALRQLDLQSNKELLALLSLMDLEWTHRVSSHALSTLHHRRFNKPLILPLTEYLKKLNEHIEMKMNTYINNVTKFNDLDEWMELASISLARLILFNKRRSGEAAKMTVDQFVSAQTYTSQTNNEITNCLTPTELKIASKMRLVEVRGKRGRKVPILLTQTLYSAIQILTSKRTMVGVAKENNFVFANRSLGYLRGHDCLKKQCTEAELNSPELISSTKLRKYIATVTQVFNMTENDYDWLARHLGHDIRVHREFYRLHESSISLAKVSRMLLAVDNGDAKKYAGKALKDIEIEDLSEDENESSEDENANDQTKKDTYGISNDDANNTVTIAQSRPQTEVKRIKKSTQRRPWLITELEVVQNFFKTNIIKGIVPGKEQCLKCKSEHHPHLENRSWTDIKYCVKNQIHKRKALARKRN